MSASTHQSLIVRGGGDSRVAGHKFPSNIILGKKNETKKCPEFAPEIIFRGGGGGSRSEAQDHARRISLPSQDYAGDRRKRVIHPAE